MARRAISAVARYELSRPPERNGLRRRYVGGAPRSSARPTRGRHGRLPGRPRRGFSGAIGDRVFHESRRRGWTRWRPRRAWRWLTVRRSFAASATAMARRVQARSSNCARLRPELLQFPEHPWVAIRTSKWRARMYCTKCGLELREVDHFCSRCGHRTGLEAPISGLQPLMLDKRNKKIAGVCAGFARYCEVDITLVRVLWLALAFCTGVGFIAYPVAWIIMPSDAGLQPRPVTAREPQTS